WKIEDSVKDTEIIYISAVVAKGQSEDISITFWAGCREGLKVINAFRMQPT
ncbi:uncharacterized protein BDZ99DRAFT_402634, partial [Mytilinidion resinicola]